jgi:hypothetical protein
VLPDRDELQTLRRMYALVELFAPDAEWVVAFTAAVRAIARAERAHAARRSGDAAGPSARAWVLE